MGRSSTSKLGPFHQTALFCITVQQTEINKRNALVHLPATQRKCSNTSSRNGNQGNCAANKSKVVTRFHGSRLCFTCGIVAIVVNGVDVYIRIGRGAIAVASVVAIVNVIAVVSVVASTRLDGSGGRLPACIQSELRLCAKAIAAEIPPFSTAVNMDELKYVKPMNR